MVRDVRSGQTPPVTTTDPAVAAPSRVVAGVATVGALVLLVGVALSARGAATADLPTVLRSAPAGTVLVLPDGERPAREGERVPAGATVRSGLRGAELGTGDREVRLAPGTQVQVLDGARQRLVGGELLVDAAGAPGLLVTGTGGARVAVRTGAVVRLDDAGSLLRVATYAGTADVGVTGRRARTEVDRLREVEVTGGLLPGRPAPLRLTPGDAWESAELPMVVSDDAVLRGLAASFTDQPGAVVASLPATERTGDAALAAERTLAYGLAHRDGAFRPALFREVRALRADGGSWGVVVALADASLTDLDGYISSTVPGDPGVVLAAGGGDVAAAEDLLGPLTGLPSGPDGEDPAPPAPSPTAPPRPGSSPGPSGPPASPLPLPSPAGPVVDDVLDALLDLLPSPRPTVQPAPDAPAPVSSAAPLVSVPLPLPGAPVLSVG